MGKVKLADETGPRWTVPNLKTTEFQEQCHFTKGGGKSGNGLWMVMGQY